MKLTFKVSLPLSRQFFDIPWKADLLKDLKQQKFMLDVEPSETVCPSPKRRPCSSLFRPEAAIYLIADQTELRSRM